MYLLWGTRGHDDDRSKPATRNQFGKRRSDGAMQSAQVVTLKSGQQNASSVDSKSPMHSFELHTSSTLARCSRVTSNPEVEPQKGTIHEIPRNLTKSHERI